MRIPDLLREIHRRSRVLAWTGWLHLGLFVLLLCFAPFDTRTVMGLNPWIKPMKFALSITIYVWTVAWFLKYLPGPAGAPRKIGWGIAITMVVEIICITMQAARGTTSHYNIATPFDGIIFSVMGVMILLNTIFAAALLVLFFIRKPELPAAYLWGIRLGLLVMIAGSLEGMVMIMNMAHTVGAPDGGPGLPFVNWSSSAGDLRVAHMLGLHALQTFPLAGYWLQRQHERRRMGSPMAWLLGFVLVYFGVAVYTFWQAMQGRALAAY